MTRFPFFVQTLAALMSTCTVGYLSRGLAISPVTASIGLGLFAGVIQKWGSQSVRGLAFPIYCGSFAGMTDPKWMPDLRWVGGVGLCCGILWNILEQRFLGIGGRLGLIAFLANLFVLSFLGMIGKFQFLTGARDISFSHVALLVSFSLGTSGLSYGFNHLIRLGSIWGSACAALVFIIVARTLGVDQFEALIFGASFIGMSERSRLRPVRIFLTSLAFVGLWLFVQPYLSGIGGLLGTLALLSVYLAGLDLKRLLYLHPKSFYESEVENEHSDDH